MKLLLDTHVLMWTAWLGEPEPSRSISPELLGLICDEANEIFFSPINVWEIAIKSSLGRAAFMMDVHVFRKGLLEARYTEVPITAEHAAAVAQLPPIHKDPFDRMLIAQAMVEGMTLVTNDRMIAKYPGPIRGM